MSFLSLLAVWIFWKGWSVLGVDSFINPYQYNKHRTLFYMTAWRYELYFRVVSRCRQYLSHFILTTLENISRIFKLSCNIFQISDFEEDWLFYLTQCHACSFTVSHISLFWSSWTSLREQWEILSHYCIYNLSYNYITQRFSAELFA